MIFFSSKHSGDFTVNHFLEEIVFKNSFFKKNIEKTTVFEKLPSNNLPPMSLNKDQISFI